MASKSRREALEYLKYKAFAADTLDRAMKLYKQLPEGEPRHEMREALRHYLYNNNYSCTITPERPIEPEYKMVIRDDCNGDIYAVDKNFLSFHYRYALKNAGLKSYNPDDYVKALKKCQAWQDMREFPTYRSVEGYVLASMQEQQLPPNLVVAMKVNDFRDFVRNNCGEEFARYRDRVSFIKTFIKYNEEKFRTMLNKVGTDTRYTDALVDKMKKDGEAWGIEVYDEDGKKIEGPEFDRHHTRRVYSPNNVNSLSDVNSFNRLSLVEQKFHRYLHKLERARVSDDMLYFEKIMVPDHAACILDFETYIAFDFNNPERNLSPMRPNSDNLIFLNKITQLTNKYVNLVANDKREKTPNKFNHRGGRGSRGGR